MESTKPHLAGVAVPPVEAVTPGGSGSVAGSPHLMRVVGRWDMVWQSVNMIMGASIFVLPGLTLTEMGGWAPLAVVATAAGAFLLMLTFAEAGGRYRDAGGLYRYAHDAFGEYVGVQLGLLYWMVRATAAAAVANVFVTYLGQLWPPATQPAPRLALLAVVIAGSGWLNVRGIRQASSTLNVLGLAKLLPLLALCLVGVFAISPERLTASPLPPSNAWARAILLWVFAFGGFEATLIPAAEVRDPVRDGPRAMQYGLGLVALTYVMVQLVVAGTVTPPVSESAVGQTAALLFGGPGAYFVAVAAVVATAGHIAATTLSTPRVTFAMAERGTLPVVLARVHSRYRTPHVSIALFTSVTLVLALSGSFVWNASISAVARLIVYSVSALAVLRLRRAARSQFEVPAWVHVGGILFCGWLFIHLTVVEAIAVTIVLATGSALWFAYRLSRRRRSSAAV